MKIGNRRHNLFLNLRSFREINLYVTEETWSFMCLLWYNFTFQSRVNALISLTKKRCLDIYIQIFGMLKGFYGKFLICRPSNIKNIFEEGHVDIGPVVD